MKRAPVLAFMALAAVLFAAWLLFDHAPRTVTLQRQATALAETIPGQLIHSMTLDCRLDFPGDAAPQLECTCTIDADGNGDRLTLLLNPGLSIENIQTNEHDTKFRRTGEIVVIEQPPGRSSVAMRYRGCLEPGSLAGPSTSNETLAASYQSFWHPVDLNSFFTFSATIDVPSVFDLVVAQRATIASRDNRKIFRWTEPRPILGASLIVGPFQRVERIHGGAICAVYTHPDSQGAVTESTLDALGRSYNMLEAILGPDDFEGAALAILPNSPPPPTFASANSVFVINESDAEDPHQILPRKLATNWWGATVTAPWFPRRPDAGPWINRGLAEYSAWLAYDRLHAGSLVELKYSVPASLIVLTPLRTMSLLEDAMHGENPAVYPYIMSMLAAYIGDENALAALRQILRDYRYRTLALTQATDVFAQASERDLSEFMRVWFDRPGHFDYALTGVAQHDNEVTLTIDNQGNNPAFGPLTVSLETDHLTTRRTITVGARGGEATLRIPNTLRRVILDPTFDYPDTNRENNTWENPTKN